ncbi:hypothetical protein AMECASPLE_030140 [Ameca splendens]|uniref:Uncharacterized protein n=1 Tax=Ameca splendens TaxID=208324 RepID=A0ABV0Y6I0_9TELE
MLNDVTDKSINLMKRWLEWKNDVESGRTDLMLLRNRRVYLGRRLMEMRNTRYPPHRRILAASSGLGVASSSPDDMLTWENQPGTKADNHGGTKALNDSSSSG